MKTTIEISETLFRKVKSTAAERGETLNEFVTAALQDKLAVIPRSARAREPEWMRGFGKLRRLHKETLRIQRRIDEAFKGMAPEDQV